MPDRRALHGSERRRSRGKIEALEDLAGQELVGHGADQGGHGVVVAVREVWARHERAFEKNRIRPISAEFTCNTSVENFMNMIRMSV